jgi:predicted nucleic acid-binding protein
VSDEAAPALVDSNVLIDIATNDSAWFSWSSSMVESLLVAGPVAINPIIYAEISVGFRRIEALDEAFPPEDFLRLPLPWDAAFLTGRTFLAYRQAGGSRRSPLPDFYIGAHAAVGGMPLLTRDAARYRTYFPKLQLIAP